MISPIIIVVAVLAPLGAAFTKNCTENVVLIGRRTTSPENETWVVHNLGPTKTKWRRFGDDDADAVVRTSPVPSAAMCADWLATWDIRTDQLRPDCYNTTDDSRCAGFGRKLYRLPVICSLDESFYLRVDWPNAVQVYAFYQNQAAFERSPEFAEPFTEIVKRLFSRPTCKPIKVPAETAERSAQIEIDNENDEDFRPEL